MRFFISVFSVLGDMLLVCGDVGGYRVGFYLEGLNGLFMMGVILVGVSGKYVRN